MFGSPKSDYQCFQEVLVGVVEVIWAVPLYKILVFDYIQLVEVVHDGKYGGPLGGAAVVLLHVYYILITVIFAAKKCLLMM